MNFFQDHHEYPSANWHIYLRSSGKSIRSEREISQTCSGGLQEYTVGPRTCVSLSPNSQPPPCSTPWFCCKAERWHETWIVQYVSVGLFWMMINTEERLRPWFEIYIEPLLIDQEPLGLAWEAGLRLKCDHTLCCQLCTISYLKSINFYFCLQPCNTDISMLVLIIFLLLLCHTDTVIWQRA